MESVSPARIQESSPPAVWEARKRFASPYSRIIAAGRPERLEEGKHFASPLEK